MPAAARLLRAALRAPSPERRVRPARHVLHRVAYGAALLALLAAGATAAAGPAAPARAPAPAHGSQLYAVEIIVFRNATIGPSEDWNAPAPARGFGDGRAAGPPPQLVRTLSPKDYRLDGLAARLRASPQYQLIAHAAWIQTASTWGSNEGLSLSLLGVQVPGLSGTVYLERAQFLHLGMQVSLGTAPVYSIDEMHTVNLHQLQYFDHPAFGILAEVTPVS